MLNEDKITTIIHKLVEIYQPKRIYLFGSYSWVEPTVDSDLDLMIIPGTT